jgi:hypothetical protein
MANSTDERWEEKECEKLNELCQVLDVCFPSMTMHSADLELKSRCAVLDISVFAGVAPTAALFTDIVARAMLKKGGFELKELIQFRLVVTPDNHIDFRFSTSLTERIVAALLETPLAAPWHIRPRPSNH